MCGILGFCTSRTIDSQKLLATLRHRGPDSSGFEQFEVDGKHIGLGHTRLSILDLSENGKQPMSALDGAVLISFNGEIYNFQELKKTLLTDCQFNSGTDTEVLLKLYLKFGTSFVAQLNGDFAIAIVDKRSDSLFLIRDRVGVKPLYFAHTDDEFVFASEMKTLLEFGIPRKLNQAELQNYFVFKYSPQDHTLIEGIRRVKPAHILEYNFRTHQCKESCYWTLVKDEAYSKLSYAGAKKELKRLLEDAVRIRLIGDVPIGTFLSGGLDSSIIASYLKNKPEIQHYCAVKNEADLKKEGSTSDGFYAEKLAESWRLNFHKIPISSDEATTELIQKTLFFSDDLIADGSQIPSYLITEQAAKSSKVILSGMGADELFLGYAGHQISLLSYYLDHLPSFVSRPLSMRMSRVNQGKGRFLAYRRYVHKLGKYHPEKRMKYGFFNIVGDYQNALSLFNTDNHSTKAVFQSYFANRKKIYDAVFHFEIDNFLQKNLHYLDCMSMANGVESRVPFLDHRLIEFAYSIPRRYKLSALGQTKKILKDAYSKTIPEEIIKRRKAGFGMPLRSIFSSRETIFSLLDLNFFASFKDFSTDAIQQVIDRHVSGKEDNSALIYALISFQIWYRMHIEQHV